MTDASETLVNDGVNWARYPNGSIVRWQPEAEEWLPWTPGQDGPQPPKRWAKDLQRGRKTEVRAEQARTKEEHRAAEQFRQSPQGQARAAKEAGAKFFQTVMPISSTNKALFGEQAMFGQSTGTRTIRKEHAGPLEIIESEGWRLEHVGYVFQPKGSQSRDRFLSTGQAETVLGEVLGIYLFRAVEGSQSPD